MGLTTHSKTLEFTRLSFLYLLLFAPTRKSRLTHFPVHGSVAGTR